MTTGSLAIAATGAVTAVGLSSPTACAAIRAGLTNPSQTHFADVAGEWLMGHAVPMDPPLAGLAKLSRMAALATNECLQDVPREDWPKIPLLLCVAEADRPGRVDGIDDRLFSELCALLDGAEFAQESRVVAYGRVSVAVALLQARRFLYESAVPAVVIVAADSLLHWPTLKALEQGDRLLTSRNSNGFMPGEGAAALLVTRPGDGAQLTITGLGFGTEQATIQASEPLRAEGMASAISAALAEARCEMHEIDLRITDIAGEQYYFKEAALALSRTLRRRKEAFDLWHPAECTGELGSAIGPVLLAVADAACRKGYASGAAILLHISNDAGQRAAMVARFEVS